MNYFDEAILYHPKTKINQKEIRILSHHPEESKRVVEINAKEIAPVQLMDHLTKHADLIFKTIHYFFSSERFASNAPFKGFLIHGPVGTGKTELVKQVARRMGEELDSANIKLVPVDSSVIASPKWGESEQILQYLFSIVKGVDHEDTKIILLFDDLESLLLARGTQAAREWHYSLNAVFFHLLDNMNPFKTIAVATTNRPDLMDAAVSTRLYSIPILNVPRSVLLQYADDSLRTMIGTSPKRQIILKDVESKLSKLATPSIRDCRQIVIVSCIENQALDNYSSEEKTQN